MRYTEARLTAFAEELLAELDQDTVDFVPNFDATTTEPRILPARTPNLVINGSQGIAVGMATEVPPHNLAEIIAATRAVLRTGETGVEAVLAHVPGPDFPTGGILVATEEADRERVPDGQRDASPESALHPARARPPSSSTSCPTR